MMKKILLPFLCTAVMLCSCTQEKDSQAIDAAFFGNNSAMPYADYFHVRESEKTQAMFQNFDQDAGNWWTGSQNNLTASVSNGAYTVYNSDDTKRRWLLTIHQFQAGKNYDFEAQVLVRSSNSNRGAGIALVNNQNYIALLLDDSDQCSVIGSASASAPTDFFRQYTTMSHIISAQAYATLTIRYADGFYYCFVDGVLTGDSIPGAYVSPVNIAVFMDGQARVEIDEMKISYF
jgi:hypothetical protein